MRDEPLERVRAAAEERERRTHVPRRVVERAAQRHLLVVDAVRIDLDARRRAAGRRRRAPSRRAARARARAATPRPCRPPRSRCPRPRPSPVSAPKSGASACRSGREPTPTGQPPASATQAHSISPIGPSPITATVSPAETPAASTPWRQQASGSTIAATSAAIPAGTGRRFDARDPLGDEDELGVGAVEKREEVLAERLLAAAAGAAGAARSGVRGDDAPPGGDVDAAELVPERARRRAEQDGMAAPERLQVGAVGERHLDLDDDVAVCRPARVAGRPRAGGRRGRGRSAPSRREARP